MKDIRNTSSDRWRNSLIIGRCCELIVVKGVSWNNMLKSCVHVEIMEEENLVKSMYREGVDGEKEEDL